jgi:phosphatidylglycerophosphatase A
MTTTTMADPRIPAARSEAAAPVRVAIKPRRVPGDRGPAPRLALLWSSFFGAGYVPVAPGTAGTVAAIPLWYLLAHLPIWAYLLATLGVTLSGMVAAHRAGKYYGVADSGHIVIDEVAGYLVTMAFLPRSPWVALTGFVFFRIFDVLKPPPAAFFDRDPRWKNGAGVVLDDVFAGIWALAATALAAAWLSRWGVLPAPR